MRGERERRARLAPALIPRAGRAFILLAHRLRALRRDPDAERMLLLLRHDRDDRALLDVIHRAASRRQTGRHHVGAGQDESYGAAVDAEEREHVGVSVEHAQRRDEGAVARLEEDELLVRRDDELDVVRAARGRFGAVA